MEHNVRSSAKPTPSLVRIGARLLATRPCIGANGLTDGVEGRGALVDKVDEAYGRRVLRRRQQDGGGQMSAQRAQRHNHAGGHQ